MGYYINQDSKGVTLPWRKAEALIADGAKVVDGETFQENLVCVVSNRDFDAAMYCHKSEYEYVKKYPDARPKQWLVYEHAKKLSGFTD